jgi:uncharacterized protein YggE
MISSGETMEKVRVKPANLIEKLEENFKRHKEELKKAQADYIAKAQIVLDSRLRKIKAGEVVHLSFDISPPDDHTEDYERAIEMLKMSEDETVTITATQFAAFVQDKWNWKNSFISKNNSYVV